MTNPPQIDVISRLTGKRLKSRILESTYGYSSKCDDQCKQERREYLETLKSPGCCICRSQSKLLFHHIHPETKKFSIGTTVFRLSRKMFLEELDKCVVVCNLCHGRLHHGRNIPMHIRTSSTFQTLRAALNNPVK